jgi:hypothetical protein
MGKVGPLNSSGVLAWYYPVEESLPGRGVSVDGLPGCFERDRLHAAAWLRSGRGSLGVFAEFETNLLASVNSKASRRRRPEGITGPEAVDR